MLVAGKSKGLHAPGYLSVVDWAKNEIGEPLALESQELHPGFLFQLHLPLHFSGILSPFSFPLYALPAHSSAFSP